MADKEKLLNESIKIIEENFGKYTADIYKNFYSDKSTEEIYISIQELLTEAIGPANTEKQLTKIKIYL